MEGVSEKKKTNFLKPVLLAKKKKKAGTSNSNNLRIRNEFHFQKTIPE